MRGAEVGEVVIVLYVFSFNAGCLSLDGWLLTKYKCQCSSLLTHISL